MLISWPKPMATKILPKVYEYRNLPPPYFGIIPKKYNFFSSPLILFSLVKLDTEYLICFFLCQSLRMDIAQSQLWIKMSELFQNKDNADVTLVCEGETILAHSAILELR